MEEIERCVVANCIKPVFKALTVSYHLPDKGENYSKVTLCEDHLNLIEKGTLPTFSMGSTLEPLQRDFDKKVRDLQYGPRK